MMTFVIFHIDITDSTKQHILHIAPTLTFFENPLSMIDVAFKSCELFHPGCKKIVLTDSKTKISLDQSIEIFRFDFIHSNEPAYTRLKAQIEFLKTFEESSNILFIDYDMLINEKLDEIFKIPFDVGLTYRLNNVLLFNGGVLFISEGHRKAACRFLQNIKWNLEIHHKHYSIWGGFQISLLTYIGWQNFFYRKSSIIEVKGFKIAFFPTKKYNYTPASDDLIQYPDKFILHFKGDKKKLMLLYWNQYLNKK